MTTVFKYLNISKKCSRFIFFSLTLFLGQFANAAYFSDASTSESPDPLGALSEPWPNNKVFYLYLVPDAHTDANTNNPGNIYREILNLSVNDLRIKAAIQEIESKTGLEFVRLDVDGDNDGVIDVPSTSVDYYLTIRERVGLGWPYSTSAGYRPPGSPAIPLCTGELDELEPENTYENCRTNSIVLQDGGSSARNVLHELGHGLGFLHEHKRWDRLVDVYMDEKRDTLLDNRTNLFYRSGAWTIPASFPFDVPIRAALRFLDFIPSDLQIGGYGRYPLSTYLNFSLEAVGPYDFQSIMHYGGSDFAVNYMDSNRVNHFLTTDFPKLDFNYRIVLEDATIGDNFTEAERHSWVAPETSNNPGDHYWLSNFVFDNSYIGVNANTGAVEAEPFYDYWTDDIPATPTTPADPGVWLESDQMWDIDVFSSGGVTGYSIQHLGNSEYLGLNGAGDDVALHTSPQLWEIEVDATSNNFYLKHGASGNYLSVTGNTFTTSSVSAPIWKIQPVYNSSNPGSLSTVVELSPLDVIGLGVRQEDISFNLSLHSEALTSNVYWPNVSYISVPLMNDTDAASADQDEWELEQLDINTFRFIAKNGSVDKEMLFVTDSQNLWIKGEAYTYSGDVHPIGKYDPDGEDGPAAVNERALFELEWVEDAILIKSVHTGKYVYGAINSGGGANLWVSDYIDPLDTYWNLTIEQ